MAQKTRTELLEELLDLRNRDDENHAAILLLQGDVRALEGERETLQVDKANLVEEIDEVRAIANAAKQEASTAKAERRAREHERDTVVSENNMLRDRLHSMSIENARLEGVLERVREFDPVSDKQLHRERERPLLVNRDMFPPAPSISDGAYEMRGTTSGRTETWYRRGA